MAILGSSSGRHTGAVELSLPFDHYERYRITAEILGVMFPEAERLSILDVGGHFSSLKLLRPEDWVVLADPKVPPAFAYREDVPFRFDQYVMAKGGQLPFCDRAFEVVCAHDTLEHVPDTDRGAFLQDAARLTRHALILNGPVHEPEVEAAERRIARLWTDAMGAEDHALVEHLRLGLPARSKIEDTLAGLELAYVAIPNGNLGVWLTMMTMKSYLQGLPDSDEAHEALDRTFNANLAASDYGGLCYRVAYVAAREPEVLDPVQRAFAERIRAAPPLAQADVVAGFVDQMDAHLRRVRGLIGELRTNLDAVSEAAHVRADRIAELDGIVRELTERSESREKELGALHRAATEQEDALRSETRVLEAELERLRHSAAYRLAQRLPKVIRRRLLRD
jgi:hypothetical protein